MEEGSIKQKYVVEKLGINYVQLHANREGTKKSPKILNVEENKFDMVIC